MPLPSVNTRLGEFNHEISRLAAWTATQLPAGVIWTERLNELRFVRATMAWESFLEGSLFCYVRGAPSSGGKRYALQIQPAPSMTAASALVLGNNPYGKWLNERWTLRETAAIFSSHNPYQILAAPTFANIRRIRNRIVHRSESARMEFNSVVTVLFGSQQRGMTPGRLLRSSPGGNVLMDHYLKVLTAAAATIAA